MAGGRELRRPGRRLSALGAPLGGSSETRKPNGGGRFQRTFDWLTPPYAETWLIRSAPRVIRATAFTLLAAGVAALAFAALSLLWFVSSSTYGLGRACRSVS